MVASTQRATTYCGARAVQVLKSEKVAEFEFCNSLLVNDLDRLNGYILFLNSIISYCDADEIQV